MGSSQLWPRTTTGECGGPGRHNLQWEVGPTNLRPRLPRRSALLVARFSVTATVTPRASTTSNKPPMATPTIIGTIAASLSRSPTVAPPAVVFPVTLPPAVLLATVIGLGCWNGDDESMMVKREREHAV